MAVALTAVILAALVAPSTGVAAPDRTSDPSSLYPLPAHEVYPSCSSSLAHQTASGRPEQPERDPEVYGQHLPDPVEVEEHHADLSVLDGKGMWWTVWPGSKVDVETSVSQAKAAGLRQVWVRVGGSTTGAYGGALLERLLPIAHDRGLAVVAWDTPKLSDPVADAARARHVIEGEFGGQHIDAFSPDIETGGEGTYLSAQRVKVYLSRVRAAAHNMPVVATVMNPTEYQRTYYPYAAEAPYVDAFAPMVYWSCREPGFATAEAIDALSEYRPVHVIGQAYNMASEGGRRGMPSGAEVWRFLDVAKRHGAIGASLYNAASASGPEWQALKNYPWHADD